MLQQLREGDRETLIRFLRQDLYNNIFIVGYATTYGLDDPLLPYWGYWIDDELRAVIALYRHYGYATAHVFDPQNVAAEEFAQLIEREAGTKIFGEERGVKLIMSKLSHPPVKITEQIYARLHLEAFLKREKPVARLASMADLDSLTAFYSHAGGMSRGRDSIEETVRDRYVSIMEVNGQIVSAALCNVVLDEVAIINGVYTSPQWRGKGLAAQCVSRLCHQLLPRQVCLGYRTDNHTAASVYKKLGFVPFGRWLKVKLPIAEPCHA